MPRTISQHQNMLVHNGSGARLRIVQPVVHGSATIARRRRSVFRLSPVESS